MYAAGMLEARTHDMYASQRDMLAYCFQVGSTLTKSDSNTNLKP